MVDGCTGQLRNVVLLFIVRCSGVILVMTLCSVARSGGVIRGYAFGTASSGAELYFMNF